MAYKTLTDIQKQRFDRGCVVFNTNNESYAIVLDGNLGEDSDPCSRVLEISYNKVLFVNQPPNRALIPTGRYVDLEKIMEHMRGEQR